MADETVEVLKDIREWVRLIGIQEAQDVLDHALSETDTISEEEHRIIYYLTNGENGARDIANHVSVSKDTISNRQQKGEAMGLVGRNRVNAPYTQYITLKEAGLEIPDIPDSEEANND